MQQAIKAFVSEITVDSECSLNELLTEFYKAAGKHVSFDGISEQEKVDFRKIVEDMDMHESFVNHLLEHFNESTTPLGLFEVVKHIDSIADATAVRIGLEKIFRHPEATTHMKDYIKVWLMQPLQVFDKLVEFLSQMMFDDELIFNEALKDATMFNKAVKKALVHPEDFNLVSFVVFNENDIPARVHSRTEEVLALEIAGVESIKDIRERILTINMGDLKGPETGLEGLRNATDCLIKIHRAYPTMQANMINYSTRSINGSLMGGAKLSATQVVRLYAGDYSNYEGETGEETPSEPAPSAEQSAVRGLITDPEAFNALPPAGRRLVAQHLPATRKQFNQIVVNAINSVHTWMPQLMNAHTNNRELNRVIDGLAKSYNSLTGNQQGMVDWFMHKFAPAVNAYRARALPATGIAVVDNVFGGSPLKTATRIYGSGMSGGSKRQFVNHNNDLPISTRITGGGPIADYFEGVKRAQLKFNDQFDNLYRKLTAAVRAVADKAQFTSEQGINRVIESLMSITIASKKTVMKISGLKPKEDLNVRYTSMVEHVIKTIENTKLPGFGEVVSVLRSLVSVLKSTHQEALSLIKRVSEATKSSEEIVKFMSFEREEIYSKLTAQELHALIESINALVYANRGHQLTAKIERHREEEVRDYIKKVTDRTAAINDYYENQLDKWLKYNRTTDIDTKTLIKSHIKSVQAAMVYLNEKVDTKLIQWRQKMAKGGNITKKQIEDIERLTMTYMHYRPGEKILQIFGKLEKLRQEVTYNLSLGDIYKVTGVIHKIVMNAGYIELLQQLYKTLEIDDGQFDWNLFKINITKLLVDKLLCVDDKYNTINLGTELDAAGLLQPANDEDMFSTAGLYMLAKRIAGALNLEGFAYKQDLNMIIAVLTPLNEDKLSAIHSALNLGKKGALCGRYTGNIYEQCEAAGNVKPRLSGDNPIVPFIKLGTHKDYADADKGVTAIHKIFKRIGIVDDAALNVATNNVDGLWRNALLTVDERPADWAEANAAMRRRACIALLDHVTEVLARNKAYGIFPDERASVEKLIGFAEKVLRVFVRPAIDLATINADYEGAFTILKSQLYNPGIGWDGYFGVSHETTIITDIFHSMLANVIYVFNRYIALRYTGSSDRLPIPMMTSVMLGGDMNGEFGVGSAMEGTKMEAGSAIDVIGVHDLKFDKVIPDAVPFYAIGIDLINTFMTQIWWKYNKPDRNESEVEHEYGEKAFRMYVNISEFSLLHNIHEILKDYTIVTEHRGRDFNGEYALTPLSEVQLKMLIAEFNKIWGLVSGSGKEKLMNAIDYIIGEINSSILFTSKNRYEQLKRDGHIDLDVSTKLDQQFGNLLEELENTITSNLDLVMTMNPDAMAEFESFIANATDRVSKETNETARLNYVRDIINGDKQDVYKTPYEDYYKFCEFVITPIMITATSYKEAFNVFSSFRINDTTVDTASINLADYSVALAREGASVVFVDNNTMDTEHTVPVTEICAAARGGKLEGRLLAAAASLVNSAVVAQYNTVLIKQTLKHALATNARFEMPNVWLPLIPSTYPARDKYAISVNSAASIAGDARATANSISMREMYPHIKSENPIDYFNALLSDFSSDFDHLLHTFMTYPGISDRFLMQLKDVHEKSTTSLKNLIKKTLWGKIDPAANEIYLPSELANKKLRKMTTPIVPLYPADLNMQPYIGTVNVPAISLQKYGDISSDEYTMMGTDQVVYSISLADTSKIRTGGNHMCRYGPLDWIIFKLASCNTTGYTLPVMLYEMLKSNTLFGRYLVECVVDGSKVIYTPHSSGYVNNVITQNILTRSSTDRNRQESSDFKTMNKLWIANLVSTIPGLISYLKALTQSTDSSAKDYNGISVEQLFITLTTIIESFYEECVAYMPFVPFMSDFVPGTFYASIERKLTKYHPIAEIYNAMLSPEIDCDGLKFEWANRPYYGGVLQIPFPEYKNRDKYEDLKKWGGSLFQNSLFSHEFAGTMDIIARSIVRHRIIKRNDNVKSTPEANTVDESIVNRCLQTIRKCYELDPVVIDLFINNVIGMSKSNSIGNLSGGGVRLNDAALNTDFKGMGVTLIPRLLDGIFDIRAKDLKTKNNYPASMSVEAAITAALSLLYDNPNVRPFYGFDKDTNAEVEYGSIGNLIRGIDGNILGSMKHAAVRGNVDATTRGKQLYAFSVVNEKKLIDLTPNASIYDAVGTIGTSARYASNDRTVLTVNQFRDLANPLFYRPTELMAADAGVALNAAEPSETARSIGTLIKGFANTSRLAIASNAVATFARHVLASLDSIGILTNADVGINTANHKGAYELFNWLSLNGEDDSLLAITRAGGGAGAFIPATPIRGTPAQVAYAANGLTATRWDGIEGEYALSFNIFDQATAETAGSLFTDASRPGFAALMRSLMAMTGNNIKENPAAESEVSLSAIVKRIITYAAEATNAADAAVAAHDGTARIAAAAMSAVFGKAINDALTVNGETVLSWLLRPAEADADDTNIQPNATPAHAVIFSDPVIKLKRLMILYFLFTRHTELVANWVVTNRAVAWDAATADTRSPGLIADWCKMFNFDIGDAEAPADLGARVQAVLRFVATAIEISMRTNVEGSATSNVMTLVNALGSKLNDYYGIAVHRARTTVPDANAVLGDPAANYATSLSNASISGRLAVALFSVFWKHDGDRDAVAALLSAQAAAEANAVAAERNGNIWYTVLSGANYDDNIVGADTRAVRTLSDNDIVPYDIGLANYKFVPLSDNFDSVVSMDGAKIFNESIAVPADDLAIGADANIIGGAPDALLNVLTGSENYMVRQPVDPLAETLPDSIYKDSHIKGCSSDMINPGSRRFFINSLRILGYTSLACSDRFSGRRTYAANTTLNILLSSFQFDTPTNLGVFGVTPFNAAVANPLVDSQIVPAFDLSADVIADMFANLTVNFYAKQTLVQMANVLRSVANGTLPLANNSFRNGLLESAITISNQHKNKFVQFPFVAGNYDTAAAASIGTADHPETGIIVNMLPRIVPKITPRYVLTSESIAIYKHFPRSIGEYMIWNPGYELNNMMAAVPINDLINIPFNDILNAGVQTIDTKHVITNANGMLHFSMTFGLLDSHIYLPNAIATGGWLAVIPEAGGAYRGVGGRNRVYVTTEITPTNAFTRPVITDAAITSSAGSAALVRQLTDIIDDWCNTMPTKANAMKEDIGWSLNMLGGAITFDSYIDPSNATGGEPYKIYPSIYPVSKDAPHDTGLKFYSKLFRSISATTKNLGTLALAYFNRSLLTFSGVLSNYVFPNSIYGKGIFNKFSIGLSEAVEKIVDITTGDTWKDKARISDSDITKSRWKFYTKYISNFAVKDNESNAVINASDRMLYPLNQSTVKATNNTIKTGIRKFDEMTIEKMSKTADDATDYQNMLSSEFTAPSICNSFLTILHNLILGKENTKDGKATEGSKLTGMQWFMGTDTMGALRSLDSLLTYTSVLSSLVKQLSFFDMDENMERTYVTREPVEPYMGIEPEDKF